MPNFSRTPGDVDVILREVLDEFHPSLVAASVRVTTLFSHAGDSGGPALKLHGYACAATVKVNSLKDRVEGKADATIVIDGDSWHDWSYEERRAVLDHELYHLELKQDKEGQVKTDDAGRPKIGMRLHDWQLGGFAEIAERHGAAAFEVQTAREMSTRHGQLIWDWADADREPGRKVRRSAAGHADPAPYATVG